MNGRLGLRTHAASLLLAALALAVMGCASGAAPRDHFYRLDVGDPATRLSSPPLGGTLRVERLRSDSLLGALPVIYREVGAGSKLEQHAFHRWVDPPAIMIQQELVGFLRSAGAAQQVVTPEMRVRSDYVLSGRLRRLERLIEGDGGPAVVVEMELSVVRSRGAQVVLLETFREQRGAAGGSVNDSVAAFNAALRSVFERLLADLASA